MVVSGEVLQHTCPQNYAYVNIYMCVCVCVYMCMCVCVSGEALQHVSPKLRKDHTTVLAAARGNASLLMHADLDWDKINAVKFVSGR